jgi:5-methylcytosine-specific restriction endonuclease McrA
MCEVKLDVVQWDHVHPLSKGGAHAISNLRPSCVHCNSRKGSTHPFTDEMKETIANDVRALRTPQEHTIPVRDGLEVNRACHS